LSLLKIMKAEIVCIGTELLLGDVINTNAAFLGRELSEIGIDLYYTTVVGDNRERIIAALQSAWQRADIILTSGGLGPTEDDLTHECIATFLGVELQFHQEIADRLKALFKARGREMVQSNLTQAYFPAGTDILPNHYGTAPGIIYNKENKIILTFPGVPGELKDMWQRTARYYLHNLNPVKSVIKSRTLRFTGESESALAEAVSDFLNSSNPTVAPLAGKGEVVLRITAKAENDSAASALIAPVEKEITARLKKFYFGADQETLTTVILKLIRDRKETISAAEGFTGGLVTERFLSVEGAAGFLLLGLVANSEQINSRVLGLQNSIVSPGAATASEMAEKIRVLSGSDWGIGTSGFIDPAHEKYGTFFVAVASLEKTEVRELNYSGWKREDIIYLGSQAALNLLRLSLS
jgi:nicotinamide-nucleotide amidase